MMIISVSSATLAKLSTILRPALTNSLLGCVLWTAEMIVWPAANKCPAIGAPIIPSPMKPMFMFFLLRRPLIKGGKTNLFII